MNTALATSMEAYVQKRGVWSLLKKDDATSRYLSFKNLIFSKFTFSSDDTQRITSTKIKVKKVDKARFRIQNNALNEPFGIFDIAFEFVESGNYKG